MRRLADSFSSARTDPFLYVRPVHSHPIKSRPLLRSALSHYRDLQDEAETEEERASVRSTFGFAIYVRPPPPSPVSPQGHGH